VFYSLKDKVYNYSYTEKSKFMIGYLSNLNRIVLTDKNLNLMSIELHASLCE